MGKEEGECVIEELDMVAHRPKMRKVLALGDYGSGKTHFVGTFPKPLMIFSFDRGYDTVAMQPGIRVVSILEENRQSPKAWMEFRARFRKFLAGEEFTWADGTKERFKSASLDSLTFLSEYCMNHYQYLGSNVDKKATYTQYQQILENMTDIVNDVMRAVEYFCCTALIRVEKDDLTGEVLSLPNMMGSIRDQVGAKFDAVFYLYTDKKTSGEEVYRMKTVGGYREKAKIRLPSDIRNVIKPTFENPNMQEILKLVSTRIDEVYGDAPKPEAAKPAEALNAQPQLQRRT